MTESLCFDWIVFFSEQSVNENWEGQLIGSPLKKYLTIQPLNFTSHLSIYGEII
jgi:hypothetical protein